MSTINGHFAIALFSVRLMAFTSKSSSVWTVLTSQKDFCGCYKYYPFVFFDVLVHKGKVIGVE